MENHTDPSAAESAPGLGSGWIVERGEGWEKWINRYLGAWVTHWAHRPETVHYGLGGEYLGARMATPAQAIDHINSLCQNKD